MKDGKKTMSVQVHPAMAGAIMAAVENWRRRLPAAAQAALAPRDGRSAYSHALERAMAWLLELSDADFDRVQAEGAEVVGRFRALPAGYDPFAHRGRSPLRRKTDSVFRAAPGSPRHAALGVDDRHLGGVHPSQGTAAGVAEPPAHQQPVRTREDPARRPAETGR